MWTFLKVLIGFNQVFIVIRFGYVAGEGGLVAGGINFLFPFSIFSLLDLR